MFERLLAVNGAVALLQSREHRRGLARRPAGWPTRPGLHGLIAGRGCRLLLDSGALRAAEAARRLRPGALARRRAGAGGRLDRRAAEGSGRAAAARRRALAVLDAG